MTNPRTAIRALTLAAAVGLFVPAAVRAELVLSNLVVDLEPGKRARQDIEVWNNGSDTAYVVIEPSEVLDPGLPSEARRHDPDPEKMGLLVAPARMILEPGQRKAARIAAIAPPGDRERVYRITVKPVVGQLESAESGLKILVGYEVLVLVRPAQPQPNIVATRDGDLLSFRNDGNVSVELIDGRECDAVVRDCSDLPGKRLYSGAVWSTRLKPGRRAEYTVQSPGKSARKSF